MLSRWKEKLDTVFSYLSFALHPFPCLTRGSCDSPPLGGSIKPLSESERGKTRWKKGEMRVWLCESRSGVQVSEMEKRGERVKRKEDSWKKTHVWLKMQRQKTEFKCGLINDLKQWDRRAKRAPSLYEWPFASVLRVRVSTLPPCYVTGNVCGPNWSQSFSLEWSSSRNPPRPPILALLRVIDETVFWGLKKEINHQALNFKRSAEWAGLNHCYAGDTRRDEVRVGKMCSNFNSEMRQGTDTTRRETRGE